MRRWRAAQNSGPGAFAGGIGGTAPKAVAGLTATSRDSPDHGLPALRATWCGWFGRGRSRFAFGVGRLGLDRLDEGEQLRPVNEMDGFASSKVMGVASEAAGGDEDGQVGFFGGHEAEHFSDYRRANGKDLPLFALDERLLPVFVHGQVHATIGTPAKEIFDVIALAAVRLGNEVFKVFPGGCAESIQGGLLVNKMAAFPGENEGANGEDAEEKQGERGQRDGALGEHLPSVVLPGPDWEPPTKTGEC